MNISKKESAVFGALLILLGVLGVLSNFIEINIWVWAVSLGAAGIGVYAYYAADREDKSLLIISYVMLSVALLLALLGFDILKGAAVATFVLVCIAFPFIFGYIKSGKSNWGLLIPAYVLLAVAIMLLLIEFDVMDGLMVPAYVNFAVALPFFYTYFQNRKKNWWALIPGGITGAVAISFLIASSAKFIGPALLIVVGVWLLIRQFVSQKPE